MARAKPTSNPAPQDEQAGAAHADAISQLLCERVREMRKRRGWTLETLSAACGVSRSMLSQIERGRANPTLGVAHRIARAFGMSLGDLVDEPEATPRLDVIRKGDTTFIFKSDKEAQVRTLSPLHLEKDVEFYQVTLHPNGALRSSPHFESTREFLTVQSGRVRITSNKEVQELSEGDSAHYPADVPHAIENIGSGAALVFLVVIYERS